MLICSLSFGQEKEFNYTREITAVDTSRQWHKLILPDDIFGKLSPNMSDIRINGITKAQDTIEAPYLLRLTAEKASETEISFNILNISRNGNRYFYTFEVPSEENINKIRLYFKPSNFDWKVTLEGSQDQQQWFTVLENYRILSIKNELTDFQFTSLNFPDSKYRYFRISLESNRNPEFQKAKIMHYEVTEGSFRNYLIQDLKIREDKKAKSTHLFLDLPQAVPVSHIKIHVKDTFDFYRPVTITYVQDSTETEQGWKYNYRSLGSGTLNSFEDKGFKLNSTIVKKLKIEIFHADNQPLRLGVIEIKGYEHILVGRFTDPADYFLTYGSSTAYTPQYDIGRFTQNIPSELNLAFLGAEELIKEKKTVINRPLFENKIWLWVALILVIFLLGFFTVKMMREK